MKFLVTFDFPQQKKPDESLTQEEIIQFISSTPWEEELEKWDGSFMPPGIEIHNAVDQRKLLITALDSKITKVEFTVESLLTGLDRKGNPGVLINDRSLSEAIDIATLFCSGDYAAIEPMENGGMISRFFRRILSYFG